MSGGLNGNANIELRNQSGGSPYIDFSNDVSGDYDMRIVQKGEDSLAVVGGNVGIGTTAPSYKLDVAGTIRGSNVSPSDLRLKQNIQTLENSLAKITQLRGVSFNWQDPAKGVDPQIGVIAQEVEQVLPELVSTDEAGYKSVAYGKFVSILIEAIKELQKENQALKAEKDTEIQALTERLAALEAKLLSNK